MLVRAADRLIVSPGGLPNDIDLYIAQRALELTKAGVRDGGEVLFFGGLSEGDRGRAYYGEFL